MKKAIAFLLFVVCLLCIVTVSAQTVTCSSAGFSLSLPDSFREIPRSSGDDRDLVLQYSDGNVNLMAYVSFSGTDSPFLVLTGDETDYGSVRINGISMQYARGVDYQGSWAAYSWLRSQDAVTLYFVWSENNGTALTLVNEIMSSIAFR